MTKNRDIRHELEHRILLLDGGFGTMIQQYGLDEADYRGKEFAASEKLLRGCNDLLNLTRPETIREIHEKYLQAGSDVITSNTFNANSISLADYGLAAEAYRINRAGAAIAREAADAFTARNPQKPRFVGGSMGPTSHTLSMSADVDNPGARAFTFEQLSQAYYNQARGLMDGGADLLMLETVFDALNAKAAAVLIFAGVRIYQQKEAEEKGQSALPKTEVGKLLAKDLELEYPGTPTEVVKLFWRLNKCMYNTNMKEKDRKALYEQQRTLYDEELLQQKGNSEKDMYEALKKDIQKFDDNKNFISSYIVEEDEKVEYAQVDGKDEATLIASVLQTSKKSKTTESYAKYICRKDSEGHWKILGWQQITAKEADGH